MAQNLRKISAYLFGLRLLRTGISVITLVLAAKFFGISIGRDVWILVSAFIATVNSAVWGPINETFRTKFIFIREQEGESVALRITSSYDICNNPDLYFTLYISLSFDGYCCSFFNGRA